MGCIDDKVLRRRAGARGRRLHERFRHLSLLSANGRKWLQMRLIYFLPIADKFILSEPIRSVQKHT
jgi:hypothetical protein